jgi:hypothetical protein
VIKDIAACDDEGRCRINMRINVLYMKKAAVALVGRTKLVCGKVKRVKWKHDWTTFCTAVDEITTEGHLVLHIYVAADNTTSTFQRQPNRLPGVTQHIDVDQTNPVVIDASIKLDGKHITAIFMQSSSIQLLRTV